LGNILFRPKKSVPSKSGPLKRGSFNLGRLRPWIFRAICFAGLSWAGNWAFEYQGVVAANVPNSRTAYSVACSRHGSTIVTGGSEMVVKLWDARTRKLKRSLKGHKMSIRKVAVSPDGKLVGSASADWTVKVWNIESGQLKFSVIGHKNGVNSVTFSPDGKMLASCGWDGFLRFWDTKTGLLLKEIEVPVRSAYSGKILDSVEFSPDGTKVAVVQTWNSVTLLEVKSGRLLQCWPKVEDWVRSLAFSPDGTKLAGISDKNGTVWLWDVNTGKQKSVTSGKGEWNCEMAYSPDGSVLAVNGSVCIEGQSYDAIRILDAETGKQIRLIKDKYGCPSIAFATHGSEIVPEQDGLRFLQVR
jgi:WD40 repeat protein